MPYTPPEKPSQIDLIEKIDRAEFTRRCENDIITCTREMALASVATAKPGMAMAMMLVSLVWQVKIPILGNFIEGAKSCVHEEPLSTLEGARKLVMETIHASDVRALFPSAPRNHYDTPYTSFGVPPLRNTSETRESLQKAIVDQLTNHMHTMARTGLLNRAAKGFETKSMAEMVEDINRVKVGIDIGKRNGDHTAATSFKVDAQGRHHFHDSFTRPVGRQCIPIVARFDSACPECNLRIHEGTEVMWKKGTSAFHIACHRRAQFRTCVEVAYGGRLEAFARAIGTARIIEHVIGEGPVNRWETDHELRFRVIKRVGEGHDIAEFTYEEKL